MLGDKFENAHNLLSITNSEERIRIQTTSLFNERPIF